MKYKNMVAVSALLLATAVNGQTAYEAVDIAAKELNGTARFVGMGGAMSALGGDISTMGTNPAGTGLFRRADAMITFGFDQKDVEIDNQSSGKTQFRLNNVGFVIPFRMQDDQPLKFMNIGFNYQRRKSFYKNMSLEGLMLRSELSQANQMRYQAQDGFDAGVNPDNMYVGNHNNPFWNEDIGWLSLMGVNAGVISFNPDAGSYGEYETQAVMANQRYSDFYSTERGGIDQSEINFALNFNDRVYIGATLGFYNVDYTHNTEYTEWYDDPTNGTLGYTLYSDNWIHGTGVNFKTGVIVRPFAESSFRIGAAVHTPIFYRLTLSTGTDIGSRLIGADGIPEEVGGSSYEFLDGNGVMDRDFKLRTPWVFNLSAGGTLGSDVALGIEYEYEDYTTSDLNDYYGNDLKLENYQMNTMLKGMHTLRMGAEIKVLPELSLRMGYNYSSAAFKSTAYKELAYNSLSTNTDFTNRKDMNIITAGVGIKITPNVYLDMAYKYYGQKGDFRAFDDPDLPSVKSVESNHSFMATLGFRF